MKKSLRKFAALVSASVMCAVPMLSNYSASAVTQYKTYAVCCNYEKVSGNNYTAYFDLTMHYNSGFTGEKAIATYLCNSGTFRSTINTASRNIQCTYMGDPIKTNGYLAFAKVIAPMSTKSTDEFIYFTSKVIRDINGNALSTENIKMDKILMGDVNLDGKVTEEDAILIMNSIANPDEYKLNAKQRMAADVYRTGDGVTNGDAATIMEYVNGEIRNF